MRHWIMSEDSGATERIEAETLEQALEQARDWAAEGDYAHCVEVSVYVRETDAAGKLLPGGERDHATVEVGEDPAPPVCDDGTPGGTQHDFRSPVWLGGCRENPGVWSHGGTTISTTEVCAMCGVYRETIDRGCQRNPGEVEREVTYREADERSREYVEEVGHGE